MFAEVLKEVNDKKVRNMLDKPINKFHLQKIFMSYGFSFELVEGCS